MKKNESNRKLKEKTLIKNKEEIRNGKRNKKEGKGEVLSKQRKISKI